MRYRIDAPRVIAETVDGEALIINLETGCYYSADGAAEAIWALLSSGATAAQAVDLLERRYAASRDEIEAAVHRLADELLAEGLVVPFDGAADPVTIAPVDESLPFDEPTLRKYTDMQDLLLVDPIHEVNDAGWPNLRNDAPAHTGH